MEIFNQDKWFWDKSARNRIFAHALEERIYLGKTDFQKVQIFRSHSFGKILVLDDDIQSSEFDEFIYHESLVHPAMLTHPKPAKVLIIGGGEGATLREVLKHRTLERVVMVDIDRILIELCQKYLPEWSKNSFQDKRLIMIFQDAREYLLNSKEEFDIIISDLIDPLPDSPARFLLTKEFYELIKTRLSSNGIFIIQSSMLSIRDTYLHSLFYRTLTSVFSIVRSMGVFIPSYCNSWSFIMSSDKNDPLLITEHELLYSIKERVEGVLSFYDYEAHKSLFSLLKPIRKAL